MPASTYKPATKTDISIRKMCSDLRVVCGGSTHGAMHKASTQTIQTNAVAIFAARVIPGKNGSCLVADLANGVSDLFEIKAR